MRKFKFGWYGDQGLGEQLIQAILQGKKTACVCPAYDPTDADVAEGEELLLVDKNNAGRGVVRIQRIELRPFGTLDEGVAARDGMTLEELKKKLSFANSREFRADEEMRITYFELVASKPPLER
ncbi:MAG: ASCH domain-containing protein [Elusimicrobia bacterium]|nr:ASCH domain-containing protein [Elusimicrobiota bacterium]